MFISFTTALFIGILSFSLADNIGALIAKLWVWETGSKLVLGFSTILGGLGVAIIGLILYKHIVMALSAPFMGIVSETIEGHFYNENQQISHSHKASSFAGQLHRGIKINIRNLTKEILLTIPLLLLSVVPVVGLVFTALIFLVQAYYAGFGSMDYTLERHFTYKESISFVQNNKGVALGNGIVFMLFLTIPVLGVILVLPFSVTAATVQTLKQINSRQTANHLLNKI